MRDKSTLAIIALIIIPVIVISTVLFVGATTSTKPTDTSPHTNQITQDPIKPSNPSNVVIRETAKYDAPIGKNEPIAHYTGVIYWEELAGAGLSFYINTTKVITADFKDFQTKQPMPITSNCGGLTQGCVSDMGDHYLIVPRGRSFQYEIKAHYKPDIVKDTGFIVVFNSQSVDFPIQIQGKNVYAKTDYYNKITLPKGAGIVSYAPIDSGLQKPYIKKDSEGRYYLEWNYINRQMDSKHNPLMISVTYTYDKIFLAFTEQVYQQQQQQQQRQEEINRLNLIRQSFAVIATIAIIASLFSVFFAYLLARRKYESDLQRAKELPRREAADIEESESLQVPVRSMFLMGLMILPMLFHPLPMVVHGQTTTYPHIKWDGTYDLRRDMTLTESIHIELPVKKDKIYVYANTTDPKVSLTAQDQYGNKLTVTKDDSNRFTIANPGTTFSYDLVRPYTLNNNSNMLVWLDRFWLEYRNPQVSDPNDANYYFHVDMTYNVLLPEGAILYSASPSDLLTVSQVNNRPKVSFSDTDRRMDAFHDVFETQITFSYIGIIDALQNLNSNFQQVKPQKQSLQSLVKIAAQEVLIFAILGIIAPLISFFIAYWVFRRRYKKMIDRAEKDQEEQIFIEAPQVQALVAATGESASTRTTEAFLGHYFRAIEFLSEALGVDVTRIDQSQLFDRIRKADMKIDSQLVMEIFNLGQGIKLEDSVGFDQLSEMAKLVDEMIESTKNGGY